MKQMMRKIEIIFDFSYFALGTIMSIFLWNHRAGHSMNSLLFWASVCLIGGDLFHLVPRILSILNHGEESTTNIWFKLKSYGMLVSSITLTFFYVLLWKFGVSVFGLEVSFLTYLMYTLAIIRIILTLMPQNQWGQVRDSNRWSIYRNIPFLMQGMMVILLFFIFASSIPTLSFLWLAILLSFAFYTPVFIWIDKNRMLGMLMLPKTIMYLWILWVFCQYVRG